MRKDGTTGKSKTLYYETNNTLTGTKELAGTN